MSSQLYTTFPHDSLQQASQKMHLKEIRHLVVLDEDQKLVGLISDRDLLRGFASNKTHSPVSEFMSWPIKTVNEQDPISKVIDIIQSNKISALIVLNDFNIPAGIITTDDLLLNFLDVLNKDEDLLSKLLPKFKS